MSEPVARYIVNRRPMQSNNNDPRLRALYEVMHESRQIADAAEADYLFYQKAKRYANELFQWMRSSSYALVYDGMWQVKGALCLWLRSSNIPNRVLPGERLDWPIQ